MRALVAKVVPWITARMSPGARPARSSAKRAPVQDALDRIVRCGRCLRGDLAAVAGNGDVSKGAADVDGQSGVPDAR